MSLPIAVIGAGLSGLHAAHILASAGHTVMLVEARQRLGGRILSDGLSSSSPHQIDLGPSWFWPAMNPRMSALVDELALPHHEQHTAGGMQFEAEGGPVRTLPDSWAHAPAAHRIQGGMASLVKAASARLDGHVSLHLDTQLVSLVRLPHAVELTLRDGRGVWKQRASHVVLAMPGRLIANRLQFEPALDPRTVASLRATATWMAPHAKFAAVYARPFWRDHGLSGMAISHRGPLGEIHDASDRDGKQGALFGFFSAPASYRSHQEHGALERLALDQLVRLFGPEAARPLKVWMQDWSQEAFTADAADQWPTPHPVYRSTSMPSTWSGRVFLAGTEQAESSGGLLEGALEAGEAAAHAVISHARHPQPFGPSEGRMATGQSPAS